MLILTLLICSGPLNAEIVESLDSTPHTVSVPALKALSIILGHVPTTLGTFTDQPTTLFELALKLTISGKPKVRKRAIRSVYVILNHFASNSNASTSQSGFNASGSASYSSSSAAAGSKSGKAAALKSASASAPGASISPIYDSLCKSIATIVTSGFKHTTKTSTTIALYTLELIKAVIPASPVSLQKTWCRECLSLLQLCSPVVTQCVFLTFESLFQAYNATPKNFAAKGGKSHKRQAKKSGDDETTNNFAHVTATQLAQLGLGNNEQNVKLDKSRQKFLVELVNATFDNNPGLLMPQPIEAYCKALAEGTLAMTRLDDSTGAFEKTLPKLFQTLLNFMTIGNPKSTKAATASLKRVLTTGLSDAYLDSDLANAAGSTINNIAQQLVDSLTVTNHAQWADVFELCSALFERLEKTTITLDRLVFLHKSQERMQENELATKSLLEKLADLRSSDQPSRRMLDAVLSHALGAIGIASFLSYVEIAFPNIVTGDSEGKNLWLLAFFREHLSHSELSFFANSMVDATTLLKTFADKLTENGRDLGAKHLMTIHDQVWALFPRFCIAPRDLSSSFSLVAQTVGMAIENLPSARLDLVHGLTTLIHRSSSAIAQAKATLEEFEKEYPEEGDAESGSMDTGVSQNSPNRDEISQVLHDRVSELERDLDSIKPFCQNFLPLFFNIYVSQGSPDEKNALFGAIEAFLTISSAELINEFYKTVVSTILTTAPAENEDAEAAEEKLSLLQKLTALSVAFVPYLSEANLELLFKTVKPHLQRANRNAKAVDSNLQKKSWKVIKAVCEASLNPHLAHHADREVFEASGQAFYASHLQEIQALLSHAELVGTSKIAIVTAIAKRMDVEHLAKWLQGKDDSFKSKLASVKDSVLTPLPMIVMGLRETSSKTRDAASEALEAIAKAIGPEKLIALLVLGLSSSEDHFRASTVSCFVVLLQKFGRELASLRNGQQMQSLLQTATLLLDLHSSEVRAASLALLRTSTKATPPVILIQQLPAILKTLMDWPDHIKTKYMHEIRFLIEKFLKRLDYDDVAAAMPKAHIKFLQNINQRYTHAKKQKMRQQNESRRKSKRHDDDSDDDGDDPAPAPSKKSQKKSGNSSSMDTDAAWLMEDGNEAPIDFTAPGANKSVTTIDPARAKKRNQPTSNPFKTGDDGRMVIDEGVYKSSRGGDTRAGIVSDDMIDNLEGEMVSKKRKRSREQEDADSDDDKSSMAVTEKKQWFDSKGFKDSIKKKKTKLDPKAAAKAQVDTFKSKRAGGDTKQSGKSDPYAYVKPNPAFLNKRHRNQAVKQYEALIGKK